MKIFALCGSLRQKSYNRHVLEAARDILPSGSLDIYSGLQDLPHFNPDLPDSVRNEAAIYALRMRVKAADALLVASPEYIHGLPGALKNALDWLVGTAELDQKPCGIIHVTPSPTEPSWVKSNLLEILNVMTGQNVIPGASLTITAAAKKFAEDGTLKDPDVLAELRRGLISLEDAVSDRLPSI